MTEARRQLGEQLQQYRINAGLSGRKLASVLNCDQSRISRIESGKTRLAAEEVQKWLKGTGAPLEDYKSVLSLAEAIKPDPLPSRVPALRGWRARRTDRAAIEAEASRVLVLQGAFIPDVLQTAAYMSRFVRMSTGKSRQSIDSQMSTQILRQEILYRKAPGLEVVVCEDALLRHFGSRQVMINQLDWIAVLARREQVDIAVLPARVKAGEDWDTGIEIYLGPSAGADNLVMTASGDGPNSDQAIAQHYIDQFRTYQRHGWRGDRAVEFVEDLAREMSNGRSGASDNAGEHDGV